MADLESFPRYLDIDFESCKSFYLSSCDLLDTLQQYDSTVSTYIDDFIKYNNSKVSPQPINNKVLTLSGCFNKIDTLPTNIAYHWYKKINNQLDSVKSSIIKLCGKDYKTISDSIGSLSDAYLNYNGNTIPYYSYNIDYIRPIFYIPGNAFNKINPKAYANIITVSKSIDALFKHNLAPACNEENTNLIQSSNVYKHEGNKNIFNGNAYSLTAHGDNLVTDVPAITNVEQFKPIIKQQVKIIYKKLYKIISAIKNRTLINSTYNRNVIEMDFSSIVNTNIDTKVSIYDLFDILQNKIKDFDKTSSIDTILK